MNKTKARFLKSLYISSIFALATVNPSVSVLAATTPGPAASNVTVQNNKTGSTDTITVKGLVEGERVKVYSAATGDTQIGATATVGSGATQVTISGVDLLLETGGTIYVSVINWNNQESGRTAVKYMTEPVSTAPKPSNIVVVNRIAPLTDTITIKGLIAGDIVSLYDEATGGGQLGTTATVAAGATQVTISGIDLLSAAGGTLYASVKSIDKLESKRTAVRYESDTTRPLSATVVKVTNNKTGTADTVEVRGLETGDEVKIYSAAIGGTLMARTVSAGTQATISGVDLLNAIGGTMYISLTKAGKQESARTAVKYVTEPVTAAPIASNIAVVNRSVALADTITVKGLTAEDEVKVYSAAVGGTPIGAATVGSGETQATISGLDLPSSNSGTIYISVKNIDRLESKRTAVKYESDITKALPAAAVQVTNNKIGIADTVEVSGLAVGDEVKVYNAAIGGTQIGTTANASDVSGVIKATISVANLPSATGGTVYVSVKKADKQESARTAIKYESDITKAPLAKDVQITNNKAGTADIVEIDGLAEGDEVKIYDAAMDGTLVASGFGKIVAIPDGKLKQRGGIAYVSVTKAGKWESTRTLINYTTEPVSKAPIIPNVAIRNYKGTLVDTITVQGLAAGDEVRAYTAAIGGTQIGATAKVPSGGTQAKIYKMDLPSVTEGTIYISVKSIGKLESTRTAVNYAKEPVTAVPATFKVTTSNTKAALGDTITVQGLRAGDEVRVYTAAIGDTKLGETATVPSGETQVKISKVDLPSATGGTLYITVRNLDKWESPRTEVNYNTTPVMAAPSASNVKIVNSNIDVNDTVEVSGLAVGDEVKLYTSATDSTEIAKATAANVNGIIKASISGVNLLEAAGGTIYVSVENASKLESNRTAKSYDTDTTAAPSAANIVVLNNDNADDIVRVIGLAEGDEVRVYSASGMQLGSTVTVAPGKKAVNVTIRQLGASAGTIYVTVTNTGVNAKKESVRVAKDYLGEFE